MNPSLEVCPLYQNVIDLPQTAFHILCTSLPSLLQEQLGGYPMSSHPSLLSCLLSAGHQFPGAAAAEKKEGFCWTL